MTTAATQPEAVSNAKVRASVITWFEIPATDLERAISFYENSLAIRMHREPAWPGMAIFPYENERPDTSGCVVAAKDSPPVELDAVLSALPAPAERSSNRRTTFRVSDGLLKSATPRATESASMLLFSPDIERR